MVPLNFSKSINLALSERGINGMRHAGSEGFLDAVLDDTIPMHGRMIHGRDSNGSLTEESQLYDVHGRFQRAVDRGRLNNILLDELVKHPNVSMHWNYKLTGADFDKQRAWFELKTSTPDTGGRPREIEVDFDLVLGCDGAHSRVRYDMMKFVRMNFEQNYIDVLWCEFTLPPASSVDSQNTSASAKDGFQTSPNHLHIWPSEDKMFIALPNLDKSFTCTLFAPSATFTELEQNSETLESFFQHHFPGAADLIGKSKLQEQFVQNPHLPLISIKCSPHHYTSTGVILGDAAHAMVPFYGQGMNAGLEDVRVLFEHLDAEPTTSEGRVTALQTYTKTRVPDAHTINDLAFANYWEMHAGVKSPLYLFRKRVEEFLSDKVPSTGFATQYSRVSFSNQRYSEVAEAVGRQGRILLWGMLGFGIGSVGVLAILAWRTQRGIGGSSSIDGLREGIKRVWEGIASAARR